MRYVHALFAGDWRRTYLPDRQAGTGLHMVKCIACGGANYVTTTLQITTPALSCTVGCCTGCSSGMPLLLNKGALPVCLCSCNTACNQHTLGQVRRQMTCTEYADCRWYCKCTDRQANRQKERCWDTLWDVRAGIDDSLTVIHQAFTN